LYAEDLVFDSFEEAAKAATERAAEYDRRMEEHVAKVNNAWEKQNSDLGDKGNLDIAKITETRETEQTSEKEEHTKLQDSVTDTINGLKDQMVNTASANTVGFAGAAAAYSWKVKYVDGKYVLSDTYDQAFFVSGNSGNTNETTTTGNNPDKPDNPTNSDNPGNSGEGSSSNDTNDEEVASVPNEEPDDENKTAVNPISEPAPAVNNTELTKPDRVVEITIQHPKTFKEETVKVTEGSDPVKQTLPNGFSIPEDTRVKISAKANMEIENTWLTMTIIDDEGESEPIDSVSMKNYRHLFRIPSDDAYSVNIYVNENGKEPKKIMQLCLPVKAVDFDSRTISNGADSRSSRY
ncbi:MAG: hypothetical protein J6Z11_15675, partial [Candidatus Riflebacteria bacterium]|nr:hypothetical protein [Candidatus Riflebacteria bacterium]